MQLLSADAKIFFKKISKIFLTLKTWKNSPKKLLIIPLYHHISVQQVFALWNWDSFEVWNFLIFKVILESLWCRYNSIPLLNYLYSGWIWVELHCNHQVTPYVLPQIDSKKIFVNEDSLQNSLQNDYNMITTFGSLQQSKWEKFMFSEIDMTTSANLGKLECSFYCSHLTGNKFSVAQFLGPSIEWPHFNSLAEFSRE